MARLRAAYRTGGATTFHGAIYRARTRTAAQPKEHRRAFKYARYGRRDLDRCEATSSI